MRPKAGRLIALTLVCGSLVFGGAAVAATAGASNPATSLKDRITQAIDSVSSKIGMSADPTKLNCLNTEKANLETYLTDATGIEAGLQSALDGQNQDEVEREQQKIVPLETNVNSAIERSNGCKGATDLGDGTTMSVTVTGGNSSDEGDNNFGSSPAGTTRTDEASPHGN
jgi:hypothetical protein